MSTYLLMYI